MADCVTIGSDFVAEGVFRNANRVLQTPSDRTLDYVDPSGNTTNIPFAEITVASAGVLHAIIPVDELGKWNYAWTVSLDGATLVVPGVFCAKTDGVS